MTDPRVSFPAGDILNRIEAKIDRIDERTRLLELGAATRAAVDAADAAAARAKASVRRSRFAIWTAIIALVTAAAAVGTLFAH